MRTRRDRTSDEPDNARARLPRSPGIGASRAVRRPARLGWTTEAPAPTPGLPAPADDTSVESGFLLRRLDAVLEDHLRRTAHELHDEVGQILASAHLAIDEAARDMPPPARERLAGIRTLLDRVSEQLRRLAHELRPAVLDDLGLVPALRSFCDGVSSRTGLRVSVQGSTGGRLRAPVECALYRVVQEAVTNATKHARASRLTIRIERDDARIRCAVGDDGVGFRGRRRARSRQPHGLGLIGMRARAAAVGGTLRISSAPRRGTRVEITVPLEGAPDATRAAG